jgi:hypothetical protein
MNLRETLRSAVGQGPEGAGAPAQWDGYRAAIDRTLAEAGVSVNGLSGLVSIEALLDRMWCVVAQASPVVGGRPYERGDLWGAILIVRGLVEDILGCPTARDVAGYVACALVLAEKAFLQGLGVVSHLDTGARAGEYAALLPFVREVVLGGDSASIDGLYTVAS